MKVGNWYVYCLELPCDCWDGMTTITDGNFPKNELVWVDYAALFEDAKKALKTANVWEGDIREAFWFAIPAKIQCVVGFAIKQDNNGDTFVMSQVPLFHLEEKA